MKTLKFLLLAGCVLGLELGSALGQGIESCAQCICVYDNTCSSTFPCADTGFSDCRSYTFTATCGGAVSLRAYLNCGSSPETCKYCMACVKLVDNSTSSEIAYCHNGCAEDDCNEICSNVATLTANQQYTLYVCLRGCDPNEEYCANCACTAYGYVYHSASDCNSIPPCH